MSCPHRGFTLIEVAIATLILVTSSLVILMLIPNALSVQQSSRDRMLVALHAQSVITNFYLHEIDLLDTPTFLNFLDWDGPETAAFNDGTMWHDKSYLPNVKTRNEKLLSMVGEFDLERVAVTRIGGNYPLPLGIARRLDAPNDEIKRILDSGGYVFYTDMVSGDRLKADNPAELLGEGVGELQKVVWGVVGAPQQNVLPYTMPLTQHQEIYPHPPQARLRPVDRCYKGWFNASTRLIRTYEVAVGDRLPAEIVAAGYGDAYSSGPPDYLATVAHTFNIREFTMGANSDLWAASVGNAAWSEGEAWGIRQAEVGYEQYTTGYPYITAHHHHATEPVCINSVFGPQLSNYQNNDWQWYAMKFKSRTTDPDHRYFGLPSGLTAATYDGFGAMAAAVYQNPADAKYDYYVKSNFGERVDIRGGTGHPRVTILSPLNRQHFDDGQSYYTALDAFDDLNNRNWGRIIHQVDEIEIGMDWPSGGGGGGPTEAYTVTYMMDGIRTVRESGDENGNGIPNEIKYDAWGRPLTESFQVPRTEVRYRPTGPVAGGAVDIFNQGKGMAQLDALVTGTAHYQLFPRSYVVPSGYPQPPLGLGCSRLRGTDILEEDAVIIGRREQLDQVRVSMPSLERRVKYRTAALILWAKVAYDKDIRHVEDPSLAYVEYQDAAGNTVTPTVPSGSGRAVLALAENPLVSYRNLSGFTDAAGNCIKSDLHPTQVLALNYVAHAAVMVTGYRPPFYADKNTRVAGDDQLLVPEGQHSIYGAYWDELPYKAVSAIPMEQGTFTGSGALLSGGTPNWRWEMSEALNPGNTVEVRTNAGFTDLTIDDQGRSTVPADLHRSIMHRISGTWGILDRAGWDIINNLGRRLNPGDPIQVLDRSRHCYLRNPYHRDVQMYAPAAVSHYTTTERLRQGDPTELMTYAKPCLDPDLDAADAGLVWDRPISYRPMEGAVINPFPPPYADRGAFDAGGNRAYTPTWQLIVDYEEAADRVTPRYRLLRKINRDDYTADLADMDSKWARNAHEACLRLAMNYVSEHPYDARVPRPANRQGFNDRPICQKDLFDANGDAIRPTGDSTVDSERFYPFTMPVGGAGSGYARDDRMANSVCFAETPTIDTPYAYGTPFNRIYFYTANRTRNALNRGYDNAAGNRSQVAVSELQRLHSERLGEQFRFGSAFLNWSDDTTANDAWETTVYQSGFELVGYDQVGQLNRRYNLDWGWQSKRDHLAGAASMQKKPQRYQQTVNRFFNVWQSLTAADPASARLPERPDRFTAARPFRAQDRCRQLIYWKVNWMDYIDFESAPAAPADWSQLPTYIYGEWRAGGYVRGNFNPASSGPHIANYTSDGDWTLSVGLPTNIAKVGDQIVLRRDYYPGTCEMKVISIGGGYGGGYNYYHLKPVDPTLDFRQSIWWKDCLLERYERLGGVSYDDWTDHDPATCPLACGSTGGIGRPKWDAGATDADLEQFFKFDMIKYCLKHGTAGYQTSSSTNAQNYKYWHSGADGDAYLSKLYIRGGASGLNFEHNAFSYYINGKPKRAPSTLRFIEGHPEWPFAFQSPDRTSTLTATDASKLVYLRNESGMVVFDPTLPEGQSGSITGDLWKFAGPYPSMRVGGGKATISLDTSTDHINATSLSGLEAQEYNPFSNLGSFGADRNHDGKFSQGSIEASTRMVAREIARFNFYDPIAWISLGR